MVGNRSQCGKNGKAQGSHSSVLLWTLLLQVPEPPGSPVSWVQAGWHRAEDPLAHPGFNTQHLPPWRKATAEWAVRPGWVVGTASRQKTS